MPHPGDHPGHLSVHRAFVVQLDTHTDLARRQLTGQVEHVVSGQAVQFHSLETLLAFMARVLRQAVMDTPGRKTVAVYGAFQVVPPASITGDSRTQHKQ